MGKKIVCDRCGAEIKKKPSFMNLQFPAVVAGVAVKESILCDFYEFDLCDDCKVDLVEWIRKGKKELESQAAFFDAEKLNYQENIEYRDERIKELEAQIPKEGEWIMCESEKPYIVCKCSVCGGMTSEHGHYCPNCGAKMTKGERNDK